jgi:hypothetical protein
MGADDMAVDGVGAVTIARRITRDIMAVTTAARITLGIIDVPMAAIPMAATAGIMAAMAGATPMAATAVVTIVGDPLNKLDDGYM